MKKRLWSIVALSPLLLTAGCGEKPALGQQTAVQQAAPTKIEAAAPEPAAPVKTAAQGPDESVFQAKGNKNVIYSVPAKGAKIVALTFDDGPDGKYTARILDILKEQHVHATFFLIGQHAAKYPQIVKRIHEEGHAIGNHSWDHSDLSKLPEDQVREEIVRVDDVIKNITGEAPQAVPRPLRGDIPGCPHGCGLHGASNYRLVGGYAGLGREERRRHHGHTEERDAAGSHYFAAQRRRQGREPGQYRGGSAANHRLS
ncbi:polysaccharide deacetylase family protein [Paenibacillus sp. P25]|nr:polysaccharide deacetylase family protein [Paenibacillus sp. P25]